MLFILRGAQGSGKSTVANHIDSPVEVLSSDKLREVMAGTSSNWRISKKVFELIDTILEARMMGGLPTLIDATNLRYKDIKNWVDLAESYGMPTHVISFNVSFEKARKRIDKRVEEGGLYIPDEDLKKYIERYDNNISNFVTKSRKDHNFYFKEFVVDNYNSRHIIDKVEDYINLHISLRYQDVYNINENEVWVIGDIHSCYEELFKLIQNIYEVSDKRNKIPIIISLGDIIDRGPSALETYNVLDHYDIESITGNHEKSFNDEWIRGRVCGSKSRMETHKELRALSEKERSGILHYMKWNPHFKAIYLIDKDIDDVKKVFFLSHAGISWKDAHDFDNHLRIPNRVSCAHGVEYGYGENIYSDKYFQTHGHYSWKFKNIEDSILNSRIKNVDMGCVFGGKLCAYNLYENEVLTVESKEKYHNGH